MRSTSRRTSRQRYRDYKSELKERRKKQGDAAPAKDADPGAVQDRNKLKRDRSFFVLLREFIGLLDGHRAVLAAALLGLTVSTLLSLIPLYGMKLVIDNVLGGKPLVLPAWVPDWVRLPDNPRALLNVVAIVMVGIPAVALLIGISSRWQATRITKRVQVGVRKRVFDHAVKLPLHRIYALKSGGAASLLREDAGGVSELVFAMIYNPWRAIIQLVGCLSILAFTDWRLLAGSLVLIPIVFLSHRTWIGRIRPLFKDIRSSRTRTDAHATEAFGGMRVVRGFARERAEAGQFVRNNHLMARQEILAWWWMRGIDYAWGLVIPTATAMLLWYGGHRVLTDAQRVAEGTLAQKDAMTTGSLVMFIAYLGWLLGPLEALAASATQFQNSLAGLDRVLNVLNEPEDMPTKPGARVLSREDPPGRITLRDVSYTYPGNASPVLQGISLDVLPGETVALVGPSGAGKTTLCNLVARFYDPSAGGISYDGTDLRDIDVSSYRSLLGIVEQDTFLFDGSIADNIAYGRRDATMEEIVGAAKLANAHGFISELAKGYDSLIGERGVKLSGGQRQRITIARAILADPRILILDEATSNLDTESERLIQQSLRMLMKGRTCFAIAHRLSTIAHAHRIVVLEGGKIVEQGTHAQLMARSGRYRQMVDVQTAPPPEPKVNEAKPSVEPVATETVN